MLLTIHGRYGKYDVETKYEPGNRVRVGTKKLMVTAVDVNDNNGKIMYVYNTGDWSYEDEIDELIF
jgi:hypothetical protein